MSDREYWYSQDSLRRGPQVPCQWKDRKHSTIPEPIARAAHAQYAKRHVQSFERLHERGGFSPAEIIMLLADALGIEAPS